MRYSISTYAKRCWIVPALVVLLAAAGETRGDGIGLLGGGNPGSIYGTTPSNKPVENQWRRPYLPVAPAYQFDHDTILQWFMTMTPRQQRRLGHWEHKAIINEHQLRNTEVFHLKKVMHDDFRARKQTKQRKDREERREAARNRDDRTRNTLDETRGSFD